MVSLTLSLSIGFFSAHCVEIAFLLNDVAANGAAVLGIGGVFLVHGARVSRKA